VFAFTGNTPLRRVVFLLGTLTGLIANRYVVPVADHVLIMLSRMPVRMAFKALGDLAVPIKHFIVVKLAAK
jgi:hypothetical protein